MLNCLQYYKIYFLNAIIIIYEYNWGFFFIKQQKTKSRKPKYYQFLIVQITKTK